MRILHVLDHSIPLHSGYTFRTLALLREQRKLGWETFHLTSPKHTAPGGLEETVDGWHFHRTPAPSGPRLPGLNEFALMKATQARLLEVAREVQPHVIHAHSPVLNAIPALRVGRELGIPVVYEVRAFWEDAAVDHGTTAEGSLRYRLTKRLETHALRQAAHVFTICEGLRQDIAARGIPAAKVTVIPNAVDIEKFSAGGTPDQALKQQLGLQGATVLGFIGSFYAYEGLDLLLAALPPLLQQRPHARPAGGRRSSRKPRWRRRRWAWPTGGLHGRVRRRGGPCSDLVDVLCSPRRGVAADRTGDAAEAAGGHGARPAAGGQRRRRAAGLIRHGESSVLFRPAAPRRWRRRWWDCWRGVKTGRRCARPAGGSWRPSATGRAAWRTIARRWRRSSSAPKRHDGLGSTPSASSARCHLAGRAGHETRQIAELW
ncbi:MAG: glycosyltransferase [Rubrivivax sp.]|nr:glycosyltransferase [Rubrivivax sp.]